MNHKNATDIPTFRKVSFPTKDISGGKISCMLHDHTKSNHRHLYNESIRLHVLRKEKLKGIRYTLK